MDALHKPKFRVANGVAGGSGDRAVVCGSDRSAFELPYSIFTKFRPPSPTIDMITMRRQPAPSGCWLHEYEVSYSAAGLPSLG